MVIDVPQSHELHRVFVMGLSGVQTAVAITFISCNGGCCCLLAHSVTNALRRTYLFSHSFGLFDDCCLCALETIDGPGPCP